MTTPQSEAPSGRVVEEQFQIYFDDLDSMGLLHNVRYLLLFERASAPLFRALGFGSEAAAPEEAPDSNYVVASNHCDYLIPVRGQGMVRVEVRVEALGTTSLTLGYVMRDAYRAVIHARGKRTIVHVDPGTLKPAPWNESARSQISLFLSPEARATTCD